MDSAVYLDITSRLQTILADVTRIKLPSTRYRDDPVAFFREILGIEPWSRQIDVLEMLRDNNRVAWKSGRRVSKSNTDAGAGLWWYSSHPNARVILTAPTARQVDGILWREVGILRDESGRCVACREQAKAGRYVPAPCEHSARIPGTIGKLARTGLEIGHNEIRGFTARDGEAFQGYAGPHMLFIADEASGVEQAIIDVIKGNLAGGGKLLLTGNPTRNEGEFYDAFHTLKRDMDDPESIGYATITTSSEESPNVVMGREVIPGLATREWIREREMEWGRDSPMFQIHVLGEFAVNEAGRIFSVDAITQAQERWAERTTDAAGRVTEISADPKIGRLFVGLDPAGATGMGDDTVFCFRRGPHVVAFEHRKGLDDEGHLIQLLVLMGRRAAEKEKPVVVLDASGSIGAGLNGRLRSYAEQHPHAFRLVSVRGSDYAREMSCDRMRDELTLNLERWLRAGGEIPVDDKLAGEMHVMEWDILPGSGKQKVTAKTKIKRELGRSPDRYDALALACYEPSNLDEPEAPPPQDPRALTARGGALDPYAGRDAWRR